MATVYVNASTGNDSRTYAQAQNSATPWLTVAKVITTAVSGDTAIFAAGTYTIVTGDLRSKALTFQGPAMTSTQLLPTCIFDGASAAVQWKLYLQPVTWENILFQNVNCALDTPLFARLVVSGSVVSKVYTYNNCVFRNFRIEGTNVDQCGIWEDNFGDNPTYTLVGCLFYNIRRTTPPVSTRASIFSGRGSTINLTNCTVYMDTAGADPLTEMFAVQVTGHIITVKNSIIYSTAALAYRFTTDGTSVATYSDFFNMTGSPAGTGVITTDPLFVDAANADFRLRPSSPCIDTGVLV